MIAQYGQWAYTHPSAFMACACGLGLVVWCVLVWVFLRRGRS